VGDRIAFVTGGGRGIGANTARIDDLLARIDSVRENDLNAIRIRR
jgi:NAD(P)-dependent dehydrogenase (short-subunit alcohol dehydrogenase family)